MSTAVQLPLDLDWSDALPPDDPHLPDPHGLDWEHRVPPSAGRPPGRPAPPRGEPVALLPDIATYEEDTR